MLRVWGFDFRGGFGVWGLGFGVWGLGLRVRRFEFRVEGLGTAAFRDEASGVSVESLGVRVEG